MSAIPVAAGPRPAHRRHGARFSRNGYLTAAVLVILGVVGAGAFAVSALLAMRSHLDDLPNVEVPGTMSVRLEAGGQVVYYEGNAAPSLADLQVTVTGPDGRTVSVKRYEADLRNDISGDRSIQAMGTFDAERTGTYRISTDGPPTLGAIGVGGSFAPRAIAIVLGSMLIALVMTALGVLVAAKTYRASR